MLPDRASPDVISRSWSYDPPPEAARRSFDRRWIERVDGIVNVLVVKGSRDFGSDECGLSVWSDLEPL